MDGEKGERKEREIYAPPESEPVIERRPATRALAVLSVIAMSAWFVGLVIHKLRRYGGGRWLFGFANLCPFVALALGILAMRSSKKTGVDVSFLAVPVVALSVLIVPIAGFLLYPFFRDFLIPYLSR